MKFRWTRGGSGNCRAPVPVASFGERGGPACRVAGGHVRMGFLLDESKGPEAGRKHRVMARARSVAEKPRLLVIERDAHLDSAAREHLADHFEVVTTRTMARALA